MPDYFLCRGIDDFNGLAGTPGPPLTSYEKLRVHVLHFGSSSLVVTLLENAATDRRLGSHTTSTALSFSSDVTSV